MSEKTQLLHIPLDQIHEPDESLRKVDVETEEFQGLVDSVKLTGVMNPINVRQFEDPENPGKVIFGLVDGLQRFTAAKFAGLKDIPAQVLSIEAGELMEAQIIANAHKIETRPVEYSKALVKVLENNPLMTRSDLAGKLAKTSGWISERLGLLKLTEEIGALVDNDEIGLSNAYQLAKLPQEEQASFVDRAIAMPPAQFAATVNARAKDIRDAKRQGRQAGAAVFEPVAILKSRKDLLTELEGGANAANIIKLAGIDILEDAFYLGLQWALTLDPTGVNTQTALEEERKDELERRREANKLKKRESKAKDAADKAARLQTEYQEDQTDLAEGKPMRHIVAEEAKAKERAERKAAKDTKETVEA